MPSLRAFDQHRFDVLLGEALAPIGQEALTGTGGHEHADASAFLQQTLVDQHVDALCRGRRVDPVEGGELVGRRHPLPFGQGPVSDVIGNLGADLQKQGRSLIEHWPLVLLTDLGRRIGSLLD